MCYGIESWLMAVVIAVAVVIARRVIHSLAVRREKRKQDSLIKWLVLSGALSGKST